MARFSRIEVYVTMQKEGLVPVFFHQDLDIARKVITACYQGGAHCIEWTNRGDGAHEIFAQLVKEFRISAPEIMLGVGSIVDPGTAAQYINSGAEFVVGPCLDEDVALTCNKRKIPYMPGCGTVTEIQRAHALGVEIVKIFPGEQVGGPAFVKALKGPCPRSLIMPTGGVEPTQESLEQWFKAGITCAGIGSQLISSEVLKNSDYATLEKRVRETLAIIATLKKV